MDNKLELYDNGKSVGFWWQFILFAICGQLCWNVENQWFNTFLYRKIIQDVDYVTAMVIVSATLTCFSTFLFGTISDRIGKRKKLIGWGNIIWGISTIAVGLTEFLVKNNNVRTVVFAATMVVVLDGIMSFIGSIAYDCGFNVWVNDHTTTKNQGMIGWVLGVMPVIATILGTVVGGAIINANPDDPHSGNYQALFISMGAFVIVCGILCLLFSKDKSDLKPRKNGSFWHQFATPFRFENIKSIPNFKEMILACLVIAVYFTSFNFYFVHLGNWAIFQLGFDEFQFGLVEGISMIFGVIVAIPLSKLIDKNKIPLVCLIGLLCSTIGLLLVYFFVKDSNDVYGASAFNIQNLTMIIACFFFGTGEILLTEACMIWVRGLFPDENKGQFEGIRCIFFVWIPMFIGTILGGLIIKNTGAPATDSNGMPINIPTPELFLWASVVSVLAFIPLYFANKLYKKRIAEQQQTATETLQNETNN